MLLADQGADVIRVEPPGGPRLATPANRVWNRGKRSIVLDLTDAGDLDVARRLVQTADVVVENFRPGVMDRFGLGPSAATAANPRLVYCSLPGFASDDPRCGVAAWEGVVAAATSTVGRTDLDGGGFRPVYSAIPAPSSFAAFWGVVAITMALNARERDGGGQAIEVPMHDAMFTALGFRAQKIHAPDGGVVPDDIRAAMGRARFGRVSLAGTHQCQDGRWVYVHSGNKNIVDFVRVTGADQWPDDGRTQERVRDLFLTRPAREWEDLGADVATEVVECRTTREWIRSAHPPASTMLVEVDDPELGPMIQPGLQVRLSANEGVITPASAVGADRDAVRAEVDRTPARTRAVASASVPVAASEPPLAVLDGVKVLDLCIVLAGPTCGRTLAEFGADVIKIERPPRRDNDDGVRRLSGPSAHSFNIDINRGKRSIVIDLTTPAGIDVFWRLVDDADVVVQNFRLGVAERLGFGHEQVRARRPDIVYASLNMYGYDGPWAGRPGHEQLGQHGTGMAVRYGGDGEPLLQHSGAVNDYGTGLMGAFGIAMALLHRTRTGEGQHVTTSLAHTAQILQSPYFYDFAGREPWDEPAGPAAWGSEALQRFYPAADGWIFLGAGARGAASPRVALAAVEGLEGFPVDGDDGAVTGFLCNRLAREPAATWEKRLADAGAGVSPLVRLDGLMDDRWVRDHGLVVSMEHPGLGTVDQAGPPPRLARTPVRAGGPAPAIGADGRAILVEHGLDPDALQAAGAVVVD
jgi:crotonobetainyl-CoA:carnitine CoA-transferase CaiB-like acyl-CoA transferase